MKTNIRVGAGIDQYIKKLEDFTDATDGMLKATIYPGAKVIADEMRSAIKDLPEIKTTPRETKGSGVKRPKDIRKRPKRTMPAGVTRVEKEGLLDGLGISGMRYDGSLLNAKLGMDGYNKHVTEKWPKGHPNAMIARSVESGTSFRKKTPFVDPTVRKNKARAENEMKREFDEQAAKQWNQGG